MVTALHCQAYRARCWHQVHGRGPWRPRRIPRTWRRRRRLRLAPRRRHLVEGRRPRARRLLARVPFLALNVGAAGWLFPLVASSRPGEWHPAAPGNGKPLPLLPDAAVIAGHLRRYGRVGYQVGPPGRVAVPAGRPVCGRHRRAAPFACAAALIDRGRPLGPVRQGLRFGRNAHSAVDGRVR
jgi:hypothetical protein